MKAVISGLIFILIFYYSLFFNLNRPFSLDHGDSFLANFIFQHYFETAKSGNWLNLPNMPMAYDFKYSLFYSDSLFFQGMLVILINFLTQNIIITTNILALLMVFLSYLSMFLLAFFWTKNFWASLIAGIVFAFGPFTMARFPDQPNLYSLQFIPLIFLFTEKALRDPKGKNVFWMFFFLTCQLLSGLYYSVFLLIFLPIYFLVRARQLKTNLRLMFHKWSIAGIVLFICMALIFGNLHLRVFNSESIGRDIIDAESYSAWPTDYLFANKRNFVYGDLKDKLIEALPNLELNRFSGVNGLYPGLIPIVLLLLSFRLVRQNRPVLFLFWGLLLLGLVLSFGPNIHLTRGFSLPGPYRLVYEIPIFKFLRDISRFGIMVVFFSSLISALALDAISKKMSGIKNVVLVLILGLVVLEYFNKPLNFTDFSQKQIQFYQKIQADSKIKVILDYPIGNSLDGHLEGARPTEFDAYYLLFASTLHSKTLFNGYNAFLPKGYFVRTNQISVIFPTQSKLLLLKSWGVDAIVLHKDQFFAPHLFETVKTRLGSLGLKIQAESDQEILYNLYDWPAQQK